MKLSVPCLTLIRALLIGYFSIAVVSQNMSEPRFQTAVWANEIHLLYVLSAQDYIYDAEDSYSAMNTKQAHRHVLLCMKSNVRPAAFYWYLHCTEFGAAGYILYNPPTKSNNLPHNEAARTCQQTMAQIFYLSIASRSLASITLQKLCSSWSAV